MNSSSSLKVAVLVMMAIVFAMAGAGAGDSDAPASPTPREFSLRLGTQYLWSKAGIECVAGCGGTPEPIRLGNGVEWDVTVDNFDFEPAMLDIALGDSVTWTNVNGIHNVRADDDSFRCAEGCDGDGGNGDPAPEPWIVTLTFLDAESIAYYCELHGSPGGIGMAGVINVIDTLIFTDGFETGDTGEWDAVVN